MTRQIRRLRGCCVLLSWILCSGKAEQDCSGISIPGMGLTNRKVDKVVPFYKLICADIHSCITQAVRRSYSSSSIHILNRMFVVLLTSDTLCLISWYA